MPSTDGDLMDLLDVVLAFAAAPWWLGWALLTGGLCALAWLAGAGLR